MYNEQLLIRMIADFGVDQTIAYCKMESAKNSYLFEECIASGEDLTCTQYDFERDWWKTAELKLKP